jgi:protoheme IX farnesyltransferase
MSETAQSLQGTVSAEAGVRDYLALLKPRVMSLAVFTAAVGLIAAPGGMHPVLALAAILCIAAGAGAAGALNMWRDADIDGRMRRTSARPVPAGRIEPGEALGLGLGLAILSVMLLFLFGSPLAAGLLAFTIFFYAVVYTMWLKRATPQNIVIGGAAGALPPMIGWAAATGGLGIEPLLMFAVIFLWTPPHFWALALFTNADYEAAGVPMMTVVAGRDRTRRLIRAYVWVLAAVALLPAVTAAGGPVTLAVALGLNARLLADAHRLARRTDAAAAADRNAAEKRFFGFTILYLFVFFLAILADAGLRAAGLMPAGWPVLV